jgi:hypothetical protein
MKKLSGYTKLNIAVVIALLLAALIYKYRYTLKLTKPVVQEQEAIDSSYLYRRLHKEIIAHGLLMEREFNGFDATKYPVEHSMDSGMDMINNDQYYIIKLYDEKTKSEVYIAIRDLQLLNKIPFSYNFETGQKILVTAFIRNKSGVNAMYGGTIHNNRGTLKLVGYSRSSNLVSGTLDADLDAVIENGTCDIRNLKFTNAILMHNKVE